MTFIKKGHCIEYALKEWSEVFKVFVVRLRNDERRPRNLSFTNPHFLVHIRRDEIRHNVIINVINTIVLLTNTLLENIGKV